MKINENQKVVLTLGQLKRLVTEETRIEKLRRLSPKVKSYWDKEQDKIRHSEKLGAELKSAWDEYQKNLDKIESFVPRIKELAIPGLISELEKNLPRKEFESLLYPGEEKAGIGYGVPVDFYYDDPESYDEDGMNCVLCNANASPPIIVYSDGTINEWFTANFLRAQGEPFDITFKNIVNKGGLDSAYSKDYTYRQLFDSVQELADNIGPFLDKFEKTIDNVLDKIENHSVQ